MRVSSVRLRTPDVAPPCRLRLMARGAAPPCSTPGLMAYAHQGCLLIASLPSLPSPPLCSLNNTIQHASVKHILSSTVDSLLRNPDRKFIYVEQVSKRCSIALKGESTARGERGGQRASLARQHSNDSHVRS